MFARICVIAPAVFCVLSSRTSPALESSFLEVFTSEIISCNLPTNLLNPFTTKPISLLEFISILCVRSALPEAIFVIAWSRVFKGFIARYIRKPAMLTRRIALIRESKAIFPIIEEIVE